MKTHLFVLLILLASCGKEGISPEYGKTTKKDAIDMLGEPVKEEKLSIANNEMLYFADGSKLQINDGVVSHGFYLPKKEETNLIYWKHRFRDCEVENKEIKKREGHNSAQYFFSCSEKGEGVVYEENLNNILKVLKYEKK